MELRFRFGKVEPNHSYEDKQLARIDAAAIGKLRNSLQGQLILPDDEADDAARRLFFWNPTT